MSEQHDPKEPAPPPIERTPEPEPSEPDTPAAPATEDADGGDKPPTP